MKKQWKFRSKIYGALFLGIVSLPGMTHAENEQYLNIFRNGNAQSIHLDDVDKITFSDNAMTVITIDKTSISTIYDDLQKLTFGAKAETGHIENITNDFTSSLSIQYRGQNIIVKSSYSIETIDIYNSHGYSMLHFSPNSQTAIVSIDHLPSGIYIINAKNETTIKSLKIIKH